MIPVYTDASGLIFDCDGTLADTMRIHAAAWQSTMREFGCDCSIDFLRTQNGIPAEEIVKRFNRTFKVNLDVEAVVAAKSQLVYEALKKARPIVPVAKVAEDFKGAVPMSVVSGGTRKNVLRIIRAIGMADFFETVITADDGFRPKPDPQKFLEAARRMEVPAARCVVYEDGDAGLKGARAAGMRVVDVRRHLPWNAAPSRKLDCESL